MAKHVTFSLSQGDIDLIKVISEQLEINNSDAVSLSLHLIGNIVWKSKNDWTSDLSVYESLIYDIIEFHAKDYR